LQNKQRKASKGIYKWKALGTRTAGRPKNRWEDIMQDLKLLKLKIGQSASEIERNKEGLLRR
jgi:hypothetical protein